MFELNIQFSGERLALGLALAALISLTAWRLGALTGSGALAASLVGGLTYGLGGLPAAILLVAFFGSSSLLSRSYAGSKRKAAANFAKGGRRDWAQVAANGGLPVLAFWGGASGLFPPPIAWVAFSAALATVNADTWATELGVLSKTPPRLITTGKPVPPEDRKSTRLNSSHQIISYAVFCLKKKKKDPPPPRPALNTAPRILS